MFVGNFRGVVIVRIWTLAFVKVGIVMMAEVRRESDWVESQNIDMGIL